MKALKMNPSLPFPIKATAALFLSITLFSAASFAIVEAEPKAGASLAAPKAGEGVARPGKKQVIALIAAVGDQFT